MEYEDATACARRCVASARSLRAASRELIGSCRERIERANETCARAAAAIARSEQRRREEGAEVYRESALSAADAPGIE
jgi:hypothetical protein